MNGKSHKRWTNEEDFFLLQSLELANQFNFTQQYTAECLATFLQRSESAVSNRLSQLSKPSDYQPKKRKTVKKATPSEEHSMFKEVQVKKLVSYGAFCSIEGKEGLLHISEITNHYIENLHDYLQVGDVIKVSVKERNGKLSFSAKEIQPLVSKVKINNVFPFLKTANG